MADDSSLNSKSNSTCGQNRGNENANSLRAIQLLQEATKLLASPPSTCPGTSTTNESSGSSEVLQNLRTLFSPYGAERFRSQSSAYQIAPNSRAKRQRRDGFNPGSGYYKVKETWTHELFCLARHTETRVPSKDKKYRLQQCGLGRKKICFHSGATATQLNEQLLLEYPKLANEGGFEILRSGGNKSGTLTVIEPPSTGYSVPFLRDSSGLGQALALY